MRQQAIKDKEKERTNFYQKQREAAKGERAKIREKVNVSQCTVCTSPLLKVNLSSKARQLSLP